MSKGIDTRPNRYQVYTVDSKFMIWNKEGKERSHRPDIFWFWGSIKQSWAIFLMLVLSVVDFCLFIPDNSAQSTYHQVYDSSLGLTYEV